MSRWLRRTVLPTPDVILDGHELWLWDTVREWARHRSRFRKPQPASPVVVADVLHAGELAARLGVDARTVEIWRARDQLPEPDYRWEALDGWLGETIDHWAQTALSGRLRTVEYSAAATSARRPETPSGPKLRITAAVAATLEPLAPSRPVQNPGAPPAAVPVTPTRKLSQDPVGDLDRLQRYFADMARGLRESITDAEPSGR